MSPKAFARKVAASLRYRTFGLFAVAVKALTEPFLMHRRAQVAVDTLRGHRYPTYLLASLTSRCPVECSWRELPLAYGQLPFRNFLLDIRPRLRPSIRGSRIPTIGRHAEDRPTLLIRRDYYTASGDDRSVFLPYFGHPEFYRRRLDAWAVDNRGHDRTTRFLFTGTVNPDKYTRAFRFPILNRPQVMAVASEWLAESESARAGSVQEYLLVFTDADHDTVSRQPFSLRGYMGAMARSDFFLCPPGCVMPHCHNIVEAMSVGAIPITNYARFMRPALTPGENCVSFNSGDDLKSVLSAISDMTPTEVRRLRRGVIAYYDTFLAPSACGRHLMDALGHGGSLIVNEENPTVSDYCARVAPQA